MRYWKSFSLGWIFIFLSSTGSFVQVAEIKAQEAPAIEAPAKTDKLETRDFTTGFGWNQENKLYKPARAHEGDLSAFLKPATFETKQVFAKDRFPNVIVAMDGSVVAAWNGVQVRRSEDGGKNWGEPIQIAKGFMGGGFLVDEISGDMLAFIEEEHPPAPLYIYRSEDHGRTWKKQETVMHPNSFGHLPTMHMNEHGITLRHGPFKGRLIRPCRWYGRSNYPVENFHTHYTNALFSDDGGRSWKASEPFPVMGTGEACIVELSDGTLHYNTRRHWAPQAEDARWRWMGESKDGGQTWQNPWRSQVLPDGDLATDYGLMGGLVRLPVLGRDVLLFSNIVSSKGRRNGHVWASFDGGKTWPIRRPVFKGSFAYSAMNAGRLGTPSEGWVYLLYEGGPQGGGTFCRFNLSWVLEGEKTGDGELPEWLDLVSEAGIGTAADASMGTQEASAKSQTPDAAVTTESDTSEGKTFAETERASSDTAPAPPQTGALQAADVIAVHQIPWRWTATRHVLVRSKINGKGPFNLIVDTGAPAVILHSKAAAKIDPAAAPGGMWLENQRVEIEGGLARENVRVAVVDMFQLEGMNGLGLAGVRIDGVLGYEFLARYRIEFDFDGPEMVWSELDFEPLPPVRTAGQTSMSLEAIGQLAKGLGAVLGRGVPDVRPRGCLGIELGEGAEQLTVKSVLHDSAAEKAGVQIGDQIVKIDGQVIHDFPQLADALARARVGQEINLTVNRSIQADSPADSGAGTETTWVDLAAKLGSGL